MGTWARQCNGAHMTNIHRNKTVCWASGQVPIRAMRYDGLEDSTRHGLYYTSCSALAQKREREREMFYLTTHSTHFIYGYMASDIWLRTIPIVRKETRCRHIGYSYRLTARVLLYAPSHRQDNTYHGLCYTSRGAMVGTRNSSMGWLKREIVQRFHHAGSVRRPVAPWADDLPRSYISLLNLFRLTFLNVYMAVASKKTQISVVVNKFTLRCCKTWLIKPVSTRLYFIYLTTHPLYFLINWFIVIKWYLRWSRKRVDISLTGNQGDYRMHTTK